MIDNIRTITEGFLYTDEILQHSQEDAEMEMRALDCILSNMKHTRPINGMQGCLLNKQCVYRDNSILLGKAHDDFGIAIDFLPACEYNSKDREETPVDRYLREIRQSKW
ncbi:MAG: hypothetical protein Q8Q42_02295 [Nanoarchaeota archaeon]|nr:hypothetical protein [Nanoarchaeota archaeon]